MKSNKIWLVFAIGLLVLPLAASEDNAVASRWAEVPVQVDGNPVDWTAEEIVVVESVGTDISARNDAENLYILLVLKDPKFQSTVEHTGITLWINTAMKTKKVHGIKFYRKTVTPEELIQNLKAQGQTLTAEKEAELKTRPSYFLFACDTVNKKGAVVPHSGPTGIGAYRISKGEHIMVYEFRIPFVLLNDPENDVKVDPSKPFKVGAEWGGMTEEARAARMAELHGMEGMSERGDLGEGGVTGAYDGMQTNRPKTYSFWVNLQLAAAKS
jgi:hypothetical protein